MGFLIHRVQEPNKPKKSIMTFSSARQKTMHSLAVRRRASSSSTRGTCSRSLFIVFAVLNAFIFLFILVASRSLLLQARHSEKMLSMFTSDTALGSAGKSNKTIWVEDAFQQRLINRPAPRHSMDAHETKNAALNPVATEAAPKVASNNTTKTFNLRDYMHQPTSTNQKSGTHNTGENDGKEGQLREQKQQRNNKDRIVTLNRLVELGISNMSSLLQEYSMQEIPPWSDITDRYGTKPTVIGLDTCAPYRRAVPPEQRLVAPVGLFHTGTNLLGELLASSCSFQSSSSSSSNNIQMLFQPPWGKHNPLEARNVDHYVISKPVYQAMNVANVFSIVMVRHPVDWMQHMCRQPYAARWNRTHCPHLIVTATSMTRSGGSEKDAMGSLYATGNAVADFELNPVFVQLYKKQVYASLLHFWNDWNRDFYRGSTTTTAPDSTATTASAAARESEMSSTATFPRLVVRLEDIVYHPKQVLQTICTCVGGTLNFVPSMLTHRQHGLRNGVSSSNNRLFLVDAWNSHAVVSLQDLQNQDDRNATMQLVDRTLMRAFQYKLR
jgi:hypothetical protein